MSVASYYDLIARHDVLFTFSAAPRKERSMLALKDALLKEIHQLQTEPLSSQQMQRIKQLIRAHHVYLQDSLSQQASILGSYEMAGLDWKDFFDYLNHMMAVTPQQLQSVAKQYLVKSNMTIAELQPIQQEKS